MKNILILGTGMAQVDAVLVAKKLRFMVFTCSNNDFGKATPLSDMFELIDITDKKKVELYAIKNNIDLIYSVGSDLAMPTVCAVSERLNLPRFINSKTAQICLNKSLLRKRLGSNDIGNIKYQVISNKSDIVSLSYPFIIKPVDSQGQRGVRVISNANDYVNYFDSTMKYSITGKIIAEEYVDGIEISVNSYLYGGDMIFFMVTDRISWDKYPGGIINKHIYPSTVSPEVNKAIWDLTKTILKKLNIINGPVYFQIKIKNGEPVLIEATPRLDGCHLWRLIEHATGINLLEMSLKHLQGELRKPAAVINPDVINTYELEFLCEAPGRIVDYNQYRLNKTDHVEWYYKPGEEVMPINGYYEKVGYIIKMKSLHKA